MGCKAGEKMASTTQQNLVHEKKSSSPPNFVGKVQKDVKPLQAFFTKFSNDWSMPFAGSIAYSLLTAMLPIAVAIFGILGLILGSNSTLTQEIAQQIAQVVPTQSPGQASATQQAINLALQQLNKNAGFLLLIAILLAVFGGSRLFVSLEGFLNIVYRVRPRTMIRQNLMAFGMLLLFVALVPIMVFTSALPTIILGFLNSNPALKSIPFFSTVASSPAVSYLAAIVGSVIVGFILFEAIYFIVPNQHISWRNSWPGALVAAIALVLFLTLFPLYMRYSLGNYTGQIGFAVILLLFFYYFAVILMLGAEVNAFFREGVRPLPNDLATFVSTMAGKLNRDIPEAEATPHKDTQATDLADKNHIARVRQQEEQNAQKNLEKQRHVAARAIAKNEAEESKSKKVSKPRPSKLWTTVEVITGSLLAFLLEWIRLRRKQ
jgi:YihY family inner membrane protein